MNADRLPKCRPGRLFGPAVLLVVGLSGPAQANPFSPDGGERGISEEEVEALVAERLQAMEQRIATLQDKIESGSSPHGNPSGAPIAEIEAMIDERLEAHEEDGVDDRGVTGPEAPAVTGEPLGRINGQHYIRHATSGRAVAVSAEEYAQAMAYQSAMRTAAERAAQVGDEALSDRDGGTGDEAGGADESRSQSADRTTHSPAELIE